MPKSKKIAVLMESHFDELEFVVFNNFFPYKGYELEYISYLWGNDSLTFNGNDLKEKIEVRKCITKISDQELSEYAGVILFGGYVSDRLRYELKPKGQRNESPAVNFLRRCVATPGLKLGTVCHSLWLYCAAPDLLRGKKVTCSHNIVCDVENAGGDVQYGDNGTIDIMIDGDLISSKHPGVAFMFAEVFLAELNKARAQAIAPPTATGCRPASYVPAAQLS